MHFDDKFVGIAKAKRFWGDLQFWFSVWLIWQARVDSAFDSSEIPIPFLIQRWLGRIVHKTILEHCECGLEVNNTCIAVTRVTLVTLKESETLAISKAICFYKIPLERRTPNIQGSRQNKFLWAPRQLAFTLNGTCYNLSLLFLI